MLSTNCLRETANHSHEIPDDAGSIDTGSDTLGVVPPHPNACHLGFVLLQQEVLGDVCALPTDVVLRRNIPDDHVTEVASADHVGTVGKGLE